MINGEINRLLPSLRNRCKDAGVTITEPKSQGAFSFDDSSEKPTNMGLGLQHMTAFGQILIRRKRIYLACNLQ